MYDKDKITGHAFETLNNFIKFADNIKVDNSFIISLNDAKSEMYGLINKLKCEQIDILQQIQQAQNIIDGIEYIQEYIAQRKQA